MSDVAVSVSMVAEMTRISNMPNNMSNAAVNYEKIKKMYENGRPDVAALQFPPNAPVIIVGSGVSVDDIMPRLKDWQGLVYATPQTLPMMLAHGITPSLVFAMDSSIEDVEPLRGFGDTWTTLVTHPGVHPEMLNAWKGPFAFFRVSFEDDSDKLIDILYPFIHFRVGAQGCVTNMQVILSSFFRNNPVILSGVDFCYLDGKTRGTEYFNIGAYKWKPKPAAYTDAYLKSGSTEIEHTPVFDFYNMLMLCIWKGTGQNILSCSKGILEVPKISIDDVMAHKFPPPMDRAAMIKHIDERTIPNGIYGKLEDGQLRQIEFAERLTTAPKNDQEKETAKLWHKDEKNVWHRSMG